MITSVLKENIFYCNNGHEGISEFTKRAIKKCRKCKCQMELTGEHYTAEAWEAGETFIPVDIEPPF